MASVSDFVWYQHEFPWLGPGFIHAVHTDAEPGFRRRLRELGVEFFEMVGPPERSVFDQLADAYTFPDYYGQNWDSFNDLMGDVSPPPRSALLWHDADRFAARDPKGFGEASASIQRIFDSWSAERRQAVLVLLGSSGAFLRPNG
jgi:RNAse (barnase) inhibitor barstar